MRSPLGISLIVLFCGLLLAACGGSPAAVGSPAPATQAAAQPPAVTAEAARPEPLPTEPASPAPTSVTAAPTATSAAPAAGVLRVGSSLDNPPFSTYDDQGRPTGFDIALITDLARRMGMEVKVEDFTFEGLWAALAQEQVDAAVAAISITPERAQQVDFTNAYYVGQDAVLAALDASIRPVRRLDDLAQLRVGVQKGSIYESWLQENGVKAGKMPAESVVTYVNPDQGLLDLTAGQIDVFLLDRQPAEAFSRQGRAKVIGQGIYPQVYGIAVRKGSPLLAPLNKALAEAQADGAVKQLVGQYLGVPAEDVLPATVQPVASPTP